METRDFDQDFDDYEPSMSQTRSSNKTKDAIKDKLEDVQERIGSADINWKTILSAAAIVCAIGTVTLLRRRRKSSSASHGRRFLGNGRAHPSVRHRRRSIGSSIRSHA